MVKASNLILDARTHLVSDAMLNAKTSTSRGTCQLLECLDPSLSQLTLVITLCPVDAVCWWAWEYFRRKAGAPQKYGAYLAEILYNCRIPELALKVWDCAEELSDFQLTRIAYRSSSDIVQGLAWNSRAPQSFTDDETAFKLALNTINVRVAGQSWNILVDRKLLTRARLCELLGANLGMIRGTARSVIEDLPVESMGDLELRLVSMML